MTEVKVKKLTRLHVTEVELAKLIEWTTKGPRRMVNVNLGTGDMIEDLDNPSPQLVELCRIRGLFQENRDGAGI